MSNQPSGGNQELPTSIPNDSGQKPQQSQSENQKTAGPELAAPPTLSGAELKKRAKAEKAAKRAQQKATGPPKEPKPAAKESKQGPKESKQPQKESRQPPKESEKSRPMPLRRRGSQTATPPKGLKKDTKQVGLFGHLYGQPRQHTVAGAAKEVHPTVLALGLQMSSYVVCGSTARCVAMLLAFKSVIESYTTPPGNSLARHLTAHHLSPQIDYLKSCRPISISMGNAIRWLKDVVIKIDPQVTESDAKSHLLSSIDNFILQRITAADELIAASASQKIQAGDVILTYASSSIVQSTLIKAHKAGTPFRVIIVDSKPLFEGRKLARNLAAHGLQVQYSLVSAAAHAVKEATKVFLGAHAMMSNGRLYSRVGTAVVAMLAHERDIPVIVCCESVKFTERVALDSIVGNEVAPAEELLSEAEREALVGLKGKSADSENAADAAGEAGEKGKGEVLKWWREEPNLQMLNILYDVTPAEYIKMVVTEYGSLPPSSVPVVHRISTNT